MAAAVGAAVDAVVGTDVAAWFGPGVFVAVAVGFGVVARAVPVADGDGVPAGVTVGVGVRAGVAVSAAVRHVAWSPAMPVVPSPVVAAGVPALAGEHDRDCTAGGVSA